MKRAIVVGVVVLLLGATSAFGAQINYKVLTDCSTDAPGATVNWTMYAWASQGDNRGVALLALNLLDTKNTQFHPASTTGGGVLYRLVNSDYGAFNGFTLNGAGADNVLGKLADIDVSQGSAPASRVLDIGNDGQQHVFAVGSFTAAFPGSHTLSITQNGANYWPDATNVALAFSPGTNTSASFTVVPEPATLCLLGLGAGALGLFRRRRKS